MGQRKETLWENIYLLAEILFRTKFYVSNKNNGLEFGIHVAKQWLWSQEGLQISGFLMMLAVIALIFYVDVTQKSLCTDFLILSLRTFAPNAATKSR